MSVGVIIAITIIAFALIIVGEIKINKEED